MYILSKLSTLVLAAAMSLGIVSAPVQTAPLNLGTAVPQTPALYDGYLASNIGTADTSMTITPSTLRNGQSLSGYMCFVMDVNQPTVEYVCGTAAGSAITSLVRGVDLLNPTTTSATLAFSHRRFASVSVADYPTIQLLTQKLNGTDNLDAPLAYSFASTSLTLPGHLVDKDYVDGVAFQGAGVINANSTSKGVVQIATKTQAASSTASGSTGATVVIAASSATSTYNSATAGLVVVVTKNSGKIDDNFISTSTLGVRSSKNLFVATSTQSWPVPGGITQADVQCVGAGGAGGSGRTSANSMIGAGGSAGAYIRSVVSLVGTTTVYIQIGSGGTQNTSTGNNGGDTIFGNFLTAKGGTGGTQFNAGSGTTGSGVLAGAVGPSASTTITNATHALAGPDGGYGFISSATSGVLSVGGPGGNSFFGQGNRGGITASGGSMAASTTVPGTGGGGGAGTGGTNNGSADGAPGAPGECVISY